MRIVLGVGLVLCGSGLALVLTAVARALTANSAQVEDAARWMAGSTWARPANPPRWRLSAPWLPGRRWRESRRRQAFEAELPGALDLVAGSLEAGAPLAHAFDTVAGEGEGPLAEELGLALAQHRLGQPLIEALEESAERIGSRDFTWCCSAIRAQQAFGASLSSLLRTLAEYMRWREEIRGEVRALTAEGRLSAWVLGALPFAVSAWFAVANPSYLGLLVTTAPGLVMLLAAAGFMTVGVVWMRRIVRVEV